MPETSTKQKQQRPTSDIIMEAGRELVMEVQKSDSDSKHFSLLLNRSRSLDILSSSPTREENQYRTDSDETSSVSISDDSSDSKDESVKDESLLNQNSIKTECSFPRLTGQQDKSELNNNDNFRNSSCRSSSISTTSSRSSNYSDNSKIALRRLSSETIKGTAAFKDVVSKEPVRITGYLEKRSKVLGWKKFWFVLDGRLLTYYKSKADYESLSACCGCINLGIASTVRPIQIRGCKGYPLQIVTRSQVYYLRSPEKPVLEQWLLAIQEAASSPPSSSALTSWNSSSSHYFKHSFTSQSQWSLNNSSEDITDISGRLGNLPEAFYQKRDKGSLIYPSPPSLSQPTPIIHKCHSFASLQSPIINSIGGRGGLYGRPPLLSSTENLRDLQEVTRNNRIKSSTMQHSTSLSVLDSSPQAAELRKELTRKLSSGSNGKGNVIPAESDNSAPRPEFLLSAKKKSPGGDDDSHHYAEIGEFVAGGKKHYENCDDEPPKEIQGENIKNITRGESAEKDSNIYEQVETGNLPPVIFDTTGPAPVTWEPINDPCCNNINKRFPPHRLSGGNRNSLVSISEVPEDSSLVSQSPTKTPMLSSIQEAWRSGPEQFTSYTRPYPDDDLNTDNFRSLPCVEKSSKKRKGKAVIGGFFAKVFGKNKGKTGKSTDQESSNRPIMISGPIDLKKQKQMQELPPKRSQDYKYAKSATMGASVPSKQQELPQSEANHVPMKPTELPVQLRQDQAKEDSPKRTSPTIPGSRMTINSTNVMDELKQKVGHITLKRTSSRSSSGSDTELSPPKESKGNATSPLAAEARVPYVPKSKVDDDESVQPAVINLEAEKKSESKVDEGTPETLKEIQTASISISPEIETQTSSSEEGTLPRDGQQIEAGSSKKPPPIPKKSKKENSKLPAEMASISGSPQLKRNGSKSNEDFQTKLAKFNRLSQTLSANFIAALHPTQTNSGFNSVNRSNSYKVSKSNRNVVDETLPPLPPKKRNADGLISASTGTIALYDVPLNNKPVPFKRPQKSMEKLMKDSMSESEERSVCTYIRELTKKNSTPDIVISGNSSSKSICLRDVMADSNELKWTLNGSSDENLTQRSNSSTPPGRPPKPPVKPKPADLGSNRVKRSSESSVSSEGSIDQPQDASFTINGSVIHEAPHNLAPAFPLVDPVSEASHMKFSCPIHPVTSDIIMPFPERILPDSLASTPNTELTISRADDHQEFLDSDVEPLSINKLEIMIRDNDGTPLVQSPDNGSHLDSLERKSMKSASVTPTNGDSLPNIYQNLKFATVNTIIQEFETVEENEDEVSELYDDFPSEFYTPTPSSFSGYSPSEVTSTSSDSSPTAVLPSTIKKHVRIDAIRNTGMEQLEAFLSFGNSSSSDCSFESCMDSLSEDSKSSGASSAPTLNNNNSSLVVGNQELHSNAGQKVPGNVANRTGAISRLGHSSAVGHLQQILSNDMK